MIKDVYIFLIILMNGLLILILFHNHYFEKGTNSRFKDANDRIHWLDSEVAILKKRIERLSTKNKYKVILKDGTITELNDVWMVSNVEYNMGFAIQTEDLKFYNKHNEVIAKFKKDDIEHYYEVKE